MVGMTTYAGKGRQGRFLRTDAAGKAIIDATHGTAAEDAFTGAVAVPGGVVAAGRSASFGLGSQAWLMKMDFDGKLIWLTRERGSAGNAVNAVSDPHCEGLTPIPTHRRARRVAARRGARPGRPTRRGPGRHPDR